MASVLMVSATNSYIVKSLSDHMVSLDMEVSFSTMNIKELSRAVLGIDIFMLFVDEDIMNNQQAVIFLRDIAVEHELPIFLMGMPDDIAKVRSMIPSSVACKSFARPFDIKEIAAQTSEFTAQELHKVKKILVVDDSGLMLRNVKTLLEDRYEVILANSGAMAIKLLVKEHPDLVLLDYEMPVVNGKEVLEMIRAESDFHGISVMFLTSKNDKETIMDVMKLHPDGYLLKTMKSSDFIQAINDFFEKRKNIG